MIDKWVKGKYAFFEPFADAVADIALFIEGKGMRKL